MKTIHTIPFRSLLVFLLVSVVIQSCDDHRVPTQPSPSQPNEIPELPGSPASTFYALSDNNTIYELDLRNPQRTGNAIRIETTKPDEKILSIDFRPATGQLFALSDDKVFYSVNISPNRISKPFPVNRKTEVEADLTASTVSFDFNPVTDQIRLVTSKGENVRLDPASGMLDRQSGNPKGVSTPHVGAVAYSNNYSGATSTSLYGIDTAEDRLVQYGNPDAITLQTVGSLGVDIAEVGGFDIIPKSTRTQGREFGVASVRRGESWELDYVNLTTGKLQKLGNLPEGKKIIGIAFPTSVAYAVTKDHKLLAFNPVDFSYSKETIREKPITGIPAGAYILGFDFTVEVFPRLIAIATDNTVYEINTATGAATPFFTLTIVTLDQRKDPEFGVDVEPFYNRLHVVATNWSYRYVTLDLNKTSGSASPLTLKGNPQGLDAMAFSNSQLGLAKSTDTDIYGIDSETATFYKKNPDSNELIKTGGFVGPINKANGFDIGGYTENGYALLTSDGATRFYSISLINGNSFSAFFPYTNIIGLTLGQNVYNKVF